MQYHGKKGNKMYSLLNNCQNYNGAPNQVELSLIQTKMYIKYILNNITNRVRNVIVYYELNCVAVSGGFRVEKIRRRR